MQVGMVGVGLMGHGIARNVRLRGDYPLKFLKHPGNRPVDDLIALGALPCARADELASTIDLIILCVTGSAQVEDVLTREDGVLAGMRPGTVIVDCTTALPESTLRMAEKVERAGGAFIDAPMTRLATHAEAGTLNLLVGGDAATLERVRPVLASFTESILHVGPVGSGHRMKLLHNFVSLGSMALIAEAAAQAANAGVAASTFIEVLASGGGAGAALERLRSSIVAGDPSDVPFALGNAQKDIDYYRMMVQETGGSRAIADGVSSALDAVVDDASRTSYVPELVRLFR